MDINIKGDIISNDYAWIYDFFEWDYTSPDKIIKAINEANGAEINVKINSSGGDVFVASEIYTELRDYKGNVNVKIVGIAASAASVIAMAGRKIMMSPTAQIMVHNVSSSASGDYREMDHMSEVLKNANDTIANAYMCKSGMSRKEALELMNNETYLSAQKAKQLGLIDEIMFENTNKVNLVSLTNFQKNIFYNFSPNIKEDMIKNLIKNVNNFNQPINKNEVDFLIQKNNEKILNELMLEGVIE